MSSGARRLLQLALVALIVYFLALAVVRSVRELEPVTLEPKVGVLALSLVAFCLHMLVRALAWQLLTKSNQAAIPFADAAIAWTVSLLGRYLPGKVLLLVGRLYFYRQHGRSSVRVSACFVLEILYVLVASLLMLLVALPQLEAVAPFRAWLLALIAVIVLLPLLHPRVQETFLNGALRVLRREPMVVESKVRDGILVLATQVVAWTVCGLGLVLLIRAVHPLDLRQCVFVGGAFSFASLVGMAAVFVPAGLGVREGVLAALLSLVVPGPVALVACVGARLWATAGEVLCAGIAYAVPWVVRRARGRSTVPGPDLTPSSQPGPSEG